MIDHPKLNHADSETDLIRQKQPHCGLCWEQEKSEEDRILTCRTCHLTVHLKCFYQHCYPSADSTDCWQCQKCAVLTQNADTEDVSCCFCTTDIGILRKIKIHQQSRWVHPHCVLLIPEIQFIDL